MIDDSYDSDFPYPHLDPEELNDLESLPVIHYVGRDKPHVVHVTEPAVVYDRGDERIGEE